MNSKQPRPFVLKQFSVDHYRSSMKVGVDAMVVGALAPVVEGMESAVSTAESRKILDVGCGCGIITLMLAQRNPGAEIIGIDIDPASVAEASENFRRSPWSDRVRAELCDFREVEGKFDMIVSNPPYFDSGVTETDSARLVARHQGALSPVALLDRGARMLRQGGKLVFICPQEFEAELLAHSRDCDMYPLQVTRVRGHRTAPVKRIVMTWCRAEDFPECGRQCNSADGTDLTAYLPDEPAISELVLEETPGVPTEEHRRLCGDFYLKF